MGLLDMFGTSMDDPRTGATLQLAQGLLSSPRVMQGLAGGLSGYQQAMAQAKQQKAIEEMRALQLQQMQMQMAAQRQAQEQAQIDREGMARALSPVQGIEANAASGITGPRPAAAAAIGQLPPLNVRAMVGAKMSPQAIQQAFEISQLGVKAPIKLGAGEAIFDPVTRAKLFDNPKDQTPTEVGKLFAEMSAIPAGDPRRAIYENAIRKASTHTPGTQLTVNAGPKAFDNAFGQFAVDTFKGQREGAQAAAGVIQSVQEIRNAVAGGAYQGAGAELKLGAAKALGALGMPYDAKTVANTELFSAQANQFVLNSIKSLGANPSNADREFIEKTVPRLQTDPSALPELLNFMESKAAGQLQSFNANAQKVQQRADYLPFSLEVTAPARAKPSAAPPAASGLSQSEAAELAQLRARFKGQ